MIYRLKSKLAIHDRIETFVIGVPGTEKKPWPPGPPKYESLFEEVCQISEVCCVFNAPDYSGEYGVSLVMNSETENEIIPDIWTFGEHLFCSETFKTILAEVDQVLHQFIPVAILNESLEVLQKNQSYYWLNVRRFVSIQGSFGKPENLRFFTLSEKENFLCELQQNKKVYNELSCFPIWRFSSGHAIEDRNEGFFSTLYVNHELKKRCAEKSVTGMRDYSVDFGVDEESLVAIPTWGAN